MMGSICVVFLFIEMVRVTVLLFIENKVYKYLYTIFLITLNYFLCQKAQTHFTGW